MPNDLPLELPPVKPWDERRKSVWPLGGGAEHYLSTLAWILRQCQAGTHSLASVAELYGQHYGLNENVATQQVGMLRKYGLLEVQAQICVPSSDAIRWLRSGHAEIVIGTLHANIRFVGELLDEIQRPQSREQLRRVANDTFGLGWQKVQQIAYRLNWLRSAGLAQMLTGWQYQATDAGLEFLKQLALYRPVAVSAPAPDESLPESVAGLPQDGPGPSGKFDAIEDQGDETASPNEAGNRSAHDLAAEIGDRLESLSCDGSKHQEFEIAVRDAFAFLGFSAERLSGSGQTDVLLAAIRPPGARRPDDSASWSYKVAVDAKAATNGALGDGQVSFPALTLHREKHAAAFSVLVGPDPRPRLLQFAAEASVAVLSAGQLAGLCRDHADVPLPVADYFWLFADSEGDPRGGAVELSPVADARAQASAARNLLAQVGEAVHDIAADFGPANRQLVRFSLAKTAALSGDALGIEVAAALDFLSSSWLRAIARADPGSTDPHYVPMAPGRTVAARLRWLADAFDEVADQEGGTPESG